MRDRIWKIYWDAEFNIAYWKRVERRMRRIDICVRILLGLGALLGLSFLAYDKKFAFGVAIVGVCTSVISTVVMPACQWETIVGRVESVRHRWIGIARRARSFWIEFEEGGEIQKYQIENLESEVRDIEKEGFWLGDMRTFREEATKETLLQMSQ